MPNPPLNIQPPLHPYQVFAKDFIKSHPKCGLFLDMGLGKACDDNTIMYTPAGRRRLGDLQVGDLVYDHAGQPTRITAVYKHPQKEAYKVYLDDGRSFICSPDHLIPLIATYPGHPEIATIRPKPLSDLLAAPAEHYAIPRNGPIDYASQDLRISPIMMGTILRYGKLIWDKPGIVLRLDLNQIPPIGDDLPLHCFAGLKPVAPQIWQLEHPSLVQELLNLGYYPDTAMSTIPDIYRFNTDIVREQLLMTLLGMPYKTTVDTIIPVRDKLTVRALMPSRSLADDTANLARSLGFSAAVIITGRQVELECKLYTDQQQVEPVNITGIEPVPARDMTCFTVESPRHTYLINDYIVTHNTRVTLEALYEMALPGHILVVAPKTIARSTWIDEIEKWRIPIRYKSLIVNDKGKKLTRKARLARYAEIATDPPTMYFINRELFSDLVDNMPVVNGRPVWYFPTVIVDELQSFKSYASQRFKAMKYVSPAIRTFVGLTGTPTPEGLMDLWPQIFLMDGGERLGKTITAFRTKYFYPTMYVDNHPVTWEPKAGAEDAIYDAIKDLVVSMKSGLTLPGVTYHQVPIYLDPDEMKLYRRFARESILELSKDCTIEAVNSGVLNNKLTQLASGTIYTDPKTKAFVAIHDKKLEACDYYVTNSSGPVLLTYFYQASLKLLKDRYPTAVQFDGSPEMIAAWNQGQIPILLLHPASAGHGINIQHGGHTIIWFDINPNLEHYLQTNARLYRQGQTHPVIIHHLITQGTVDTRNMALLQHKDCSEKRLLEAVRAEIQSIMQNP